MVEIGKTQEQLLLESFEREFDAFKLKMQHLKFRRLSEQEALQIIFDKKITNPDRADAGNVFQNQFVYVSKTGYIVWIHTGITNYAFSEKGSAWMLVLEKPKAGIKQRKVFVREFYKDHPISLLPKLHAYACLGKRIANGKPGDAELIRVGKTLVYQWHYNNGSIKPFSVTDYRKTMSVDVLTIICKKENARNYYFTKTQPLVDQNLMKREEDIRSKWNHLLTVNCA
jgi:hypothetical protein